MSRSEGSVVEFLAGVSFPRISLSFGFGVGATINRVDAAAAADSGVGIGRPAFPSLLNDKPPVTSDGGEANPRGLILAEDSGEARRVGNDSRAGVNEPKPPLSRSPNDAAETAAEGDG
jgi:hypothetical protein